MFSNPEKAFGGSTPMLGLIENIYAAAQTPALWETVLQEILLAVQCESAALFAVSPDPRRPALVSQHGMPDDAWADFATYYAEINPIYPACQKLFTSDETWYSEQALPSAAFEKTEFYHDFFRPNDMYYSVGLRMELGNGPAASLSLQRGRSGGSFDEDVEIVCRTLHPHLRRALMLHHHLQGLQIKVVGLEAALDAHDQAVLGVDRLGKVVLASPLAQRMLRDGDQVRAVGGRLCCATLAASRTLEHLIATAITSSCGGALLLEQADRPTLRIVVSPCRRELQGQAEQLAALVFLHDPGKAMKSRAATLRAMYGLSPTEGRVADALLQGGTTQELAAQLRITHETARFHVKRLLTKTGTHRQTELMRLMMTLPELG